MWVYQRVMEQKYCSPKTTNSGSKDRKMAAKSCCTISCPGLWSPSSYGETCDKVDQKSEKVSGIQWKFRKNEWTWMNQLLNQASSCSWTEATASPLVEKQFFAARPSQSGRPLARSVARWCAALSSPVDGSIPSGTFGTRACLGVDSENRWCHSIQFGVPKHSLKLSPDHANIMFLALSRPAALRPRRAATCGRGGGGSGSHLCQSWLQADTRWLGSTADIARIVPQYPKHVTRSKIPWRSQLNWNFPWVPGRISSFLALITWCQLMLRFLVQKRYTSGFSYQLMMFTPLNESIIMYIMLNAWHSPGQEWVETPFWSCNHNISLRKIICLAMLDPSEWGKNSGSLK